ncbi:hypothetical protein GCM10022225_62770 [Plantactinospora mayteni]|uniref:Uncharacterized protein n=1 Tax=Plantactinospora mayteni TaxID=566021 RepID=A0ABQ4EZ87_9ACTN|nr:hypothetical protein [Plantactinospora mayteni]GIG99980.1 hypothetical protein Pma05_65530 [Plantactinospora mayteni]
MGSPERKAAGPAAGQLTGGGEAFDRLFGRGRDAVLAGTHYRDSPPVDGGRWGLSVVLLPDPACAARLAAVTAELLRFRFNGRQPVRVPLASAPFGAGTG